MIERMLVAVGGGPGAGKTSVLERLRDRGFSVVPEVARRIIADRRAKGLSPRPPPLEFAQAILSKDVEQYAVALSATDHVFFDRSILDSLGMLHGLGALTAPQRSEMLKRHPYHPRAFIFPPWEDIYHTDSERDQSFTEAVRVHDSVCRWYSECGYVLIEVPTGTVDERCDFMLEALKDAAVVSGTEGYAAEAPALFTRYENFDFSQVHGPVLHLFPNTPSSIIDIGAGTGRDAAYMASVGHRVLAVEPTDELRERAKLIRPPRNLTWLNDSLPYLTDVLQLNHTFDVIMLNAVWMHLDEQQRARGMHNLALLAHAGTRVFMSLRHGPVPQGRRMFDVSGDETVQLGRTNGFRCLFNAHSESIQRENAAAGVSWTRVVLERT